MNKLDKISSENDFIIPNYNEINLVDLAKTIYNRFGKKYELTENIKQLNELIPNNKHVLLILSDGTGSNLIDKLDDNSILKQNKKRDIITIFPSTTGCVLTSLVTASYPIEHGIWGWFNYNRKFNRDYLPVLFRDRKSKNDLTAFNIKSKDIFKIKSNLKELNTKVNVLFPNYIIDSIYSKFVSYDSDRVAYENYDDIKNTMDNICKNYESSYTYLYLPFIDSCEHDNGIDSDDVFIKLKEVNNLVEKLKEIKDLTIIFTADHGQTNVYKDVVMDFQKYDKYFYAYPSIDCGTASYFIKEELKEEFEKEFNNDFKDDMYLFKIEEFITNKIFGNSNYNEEAINNLGEYISICKKGSFFINSPNKEDYLGKVKGNHSGLTKDEMIIPLIIIDTNNKYLK